MPRQTEPNANNALGNLLQGMLPGRQVWSENTQAVVGHAGLRPDIVVTAPGRSPVVVEAEYRHGPVDRSPPGGAPQRHHSAPHGLLLARGEVLELEERAAGEVARVLTGQMSDNPVNPDVFSHSRATIEGA